MIKAIILIILLLQPTPYSPTDSIVWPSAGSVSWGHLEKQSYGIPQVVSYMNVTTIRWQVEGTWLLDYNEYDEKKIEGLRVHHIDKDLGIKSISLSAVLLLTEKKTDFGLKDSIPVEVIKRNKKNEPVLYQLSDTPWFYVPRGNRHYFFNWLESAEQFLEKKGPVPYDEPFPYRLFHKVYAEQPFYLSYSNEVGGQEYFEETTGQPIHDTREYPYHPASILTWRMTEGKKLITIRAEDYLTEEMAEKHYELFKHLDNKHGSRHKLKEVKIEDGFVIYRREATIREGMTY